MNPCIPQKSIGLPTEDTLELVISDPVRCKYITMGILIFQVAFSYSLNHAQSFLLVNDSFLFGEASSTLQHKSHLHDHLCELHLSHFIVITLLNIIAVARYVCGRRSHSNKNSRY